MIKNSLIIDSGRFEYISASNLQWLDFVAVYDEGTYTVWKNRYTNHQNVELDENEFNVLIKQITDKNNEPTFIRCEMNPRYWGDATVNGVVDDEHNPKMPLVEGITWKIVINVETGKILDWPKGTTACVHYKVCDTGSYYILSRDFKVLKECFCYVPSFLSPGGDGYGDYVIMNIDENGYIEDWKKPNDFLKIS